MSNTPEFITYTYHEDTDIHEVIFHKSNRKAVDEYLDHITRLSNEIPRMQETRNLIDLRESGMPPIAYLSAKLRKHMASLGERGKSRVVVLYNDSTLLTLIQSVMNMFTKRGVDEFTFVKSDRDEAIAWLSETVETAE